MTILLPADVRFTMLNRNRAVNGEPQLHSNGSLVRAARTYRTTDPATLADRLASRDYTDFRLIPLFYRNKGVAKGRRYVLTCRYPTDPARPIIEEYRAGVSFLIDHTGCQSFRVIPYLIHFACENKFIGANVRCHHTSPLLDDWLAEPWVPAELARLNLDGASNRLQEAHNLTGVHVVNWIGNHRPRLARQFNEALEVYRPKSNDSLWSVLQALTHARRVGLQALADRIMTVDWATVSNREIPAYWN